MALSNIFREPRREITETAVGLAVVGLVGGGYCWVDYRFAIWFQAVTGGENGGCPWPIGLLYGVGATFGAWLLLLLIHAIGDRVCDALQRRGVHLRPRQRY